MLTGSVGQTISDRCPGWRDRIEVGRFPDVVDGWNAREAKLAAITNEALMFLSLGSKISLPTVRVPLMPVGVMFVSMAAPVAVFHTVPLVNPTTR